MVDPRKTMAVRPVVGRSLRCRAKSARTGRTSTSGYRPASPAAASANALVDTSRVTIRCKAPARCHASRSSCVLVEDPEPSSMTVFTGAAAAISSAYASRIWRSVLVG